MVGAPAGESRVIAERYTVVSAIGQGGMGRVWRARDLILDREVALKELLLPSNMSASVRKEMSDRLLKEARLGARLRHPAIVRVYDVLTVDGNPWMVMELITGQSLDDMVLDGGPLPPTRVAEIGVALLGALGAAHRAGVLHRDVKPANVIIDNDSSVSLTDFGIAFELDKTSLTATGLMIGSPPFIAPERVRGETVGPPSDLFSLGATLYAAVEGRPPFDREGPLPTLAAILNESPDPFQLAGPLQPVLAGLLDKDQHNRMSAEAATAALERISRSTPSALPDTDPLLATPPPPLTWPGRPVGTQGGRPIPSQPVSSQPSSGGPRGLGSVPPPAPEQEASTVQVHQTQILPMGGSPVGRAPVRTPSPTGRASVSRPPTPAPTTPHATGRASISSPPAPPIRPVPPAPSRPSSPARGYAGPPRQPPPYQPPYQPPPAPRRRRTPLVVAAIVLALLLAAGAGVVVVLSQRSSNVPTANGSSAGQPSDSAPAPSGTPDAELKPVSQIDGYSVSVPADWHSVSTESDVLYGYSPPGLPTGTKVRIAFSSPGSANGRSAVKVFETGSNARAQAGEGSQYYVPGFHVLGIKSVSFAGRSDGASWEYTWLDGSVRRHNLIYGAVGDNGRSYQLSFQASVDDYPKYQALFAKVVAGAKVTV